MRIREYNKAGNAVRITKVNCDNMANLLFEIMSCDDEFVSDVHIERLNKELQLLTESVNHLKHTMGAYYEG